MIGSLTPGKCADSVILRCDDLATMPLNNLAATVVLAADRRSVDMVMVDDVILKCHDSRIAADIAAIRSTVVTLRERL